MAELSFPWASLGGRRSQLGVLVPWFLHPTLLVPWAGACPVLRFRVSTEAMGVGYPWPLLRGLVEIEPGPL